MEDTGERMVPELSNGPTFWAHVYRYAFASRFAKGRNVLDVACGEGYGSAALRSAGAARVIGIDLSEEACRHARCRYGVDVFDANAESIPIAASSIDTVVSFETIEHVPNAFRFLDECKRVLRPGGTLVISTPNKDVYSGKGLNPFHCSEMTEQEFSAALESRFRVVKLYSQHPGWAPWWSAQTLAADETPWDRWSPSRRLHLFARFRLAPACMHNPDSSQRADVIRQVLNGGIRGIRALIPYVIRPRRRWSREKPYFFVATAVRGRE